MTDAALARKEAPKAERRRPAKGVVGDSKVGDPSTEVRFSSRKRPVSPFKKADTTRPDSCMSLLSYCPSPIPTKVAFPRNGSARHAQVTMKQVGSTVIAPPSEAGSGLVTSPPIRPRGIRQLSHRSPRSLRRTTHGLKRAPLPAVTVPADWAKAAPLPGRTTREIRSSANETQGPLAPRDQGTAPAQTTGDQAERWGRLVVRTLLFWSLASLIWSLAVGGK